MRQLNHLIAGSVLVIMVLVHSWAGAAEPVVATFYAMGDVPYTPEDDAILPKHIAALPSDAEFIVHVGDIKDGSTPCDEAVYVKVSGMLRKSAHRLFIVPGDNEWNDCAKPAPSWDFWTKYFMKFDRYWENGLVVARQEKRQENFTFFHKDILFIGINLVGGKVHDAEEWKNRHRQNVNWIRQQLEKNGEKSRCMVLFGHAQPATKHDDFFGPFVEIAGAYGKPVLYLHGDGHRWIKDRPFGAKNILRVQVDQGAIASPLKVTVGLNEEAPFGFERRK
ncbi:MAG: metallophosphoesterase [Pirellulaceae bacterium]|nr:metallophosphoesterase [Pirellulaceae bacterium]